MDKKETILFDGVVALLEHMVDGINAYKKEGLDASLFWDEEKVKKAGWFLHNIAHMKGSTHVHKKKE